MMQVLKNGLTRMGALMLALVLFVSMPVQASAAATTKVKIDYNGKVVDSFNDVEAKYITGTGNSSTGEYSDAQYVKNYYAKVYGVEVHDLLPGKTPKSSTEGYSFRQIQTAILPGDIGYHNTNDKGSPHWFIVKSVSGDNITVIEQNWKWKEGSYTYANANRTVTLNVTPYLRVYRLYRNGQSANQPQSSSAASNPAFVDGIYYIQSALPGNYVVDIPGSSAESAQEANLWTWNGGNNQKVWIHSIGGGRYSIDFVHSGQVMNIYGNPDTSVTGMKIIQYKWTGEGCEKWAILPNPDGTVCLEANGLYLDAYQATAKGCDGCPLIAYTPNGGTNQKWRLISENDVPQPNPDPNASAAVRFPLKGGVTRSSSAKTSGFYCDYRASKGTPIYAPANGTVTLYQSYAVNHRKLASYGNNLVFTSSDGVYTMKMAHLSGFGSSLPYHLKYTSSLPYPCSVSKYSCETVPVSSAQLPVSQGQVLGYVGDTGNASGPHLHLEVQKNGVPVDPASVLTVWN